MIVHKGAEPLGISIVSGENGGIFVSKVTGGSIAHQAGLEYGDQLLEVSTMARLNPHVQVSRNYQSSAVILNASFLFTSECLIWVVTV